MGPAVIYDKVNFLLDMCEAKDMASFMASSLGAQKQNYERGEQNKRKSTMLTGS